MRGALTGKGGEGGGHSGRTVAQVGVKWRCQAAAESEAYTTDKRCTGRRRRRRARGEGGEGEGGEAGRRVV